MLPTSSAISMIQKLIFKKWLNTFLFSTFCHLYTQCWWNCTGISRVFPEDVKQHGDFQNFSPQFPNMILWNFRYRKKYSIHFAACCDRSPLDRWRSEAGSPRRSLSSRTTSRRLRRVLLQRSLVYWSWGISKISNFNCLAHEIVRKIVWKKSSEYKSRFPNDSSRSARRGLGKEN